MSQLIAILCSDLHLTLQKPACRNDKDWMKTQAFYLKQITKLQATNSEVKVIVAGDIFDKWNPAPELINFALQYLPTGMICVPGQHDLPNHRIDLMHRSGYGVLDECRKIVDISGEKLVCRNFTAYGFGWEQEITPLEDRSTNKIHIAVVHRYCWKEGHSYPGAPATGNVNHLRKLLKGYNVAVFGDNHKGFLSQFDDTWVMNCGGFIRRKADEKDYRPRVGLLYSNGEVEQHCLELDDVFHDDAVERDAQAFDMRAFISGLEGLGEQGLDFKEAILQHMEREKTDDATRQIILAALEQK